MRVKSWGIVGTFPTGGPRVEVQETRVQTDRVLTIPNILSMARLVGVPVFLWLILWPVFGGPNCDVWALVVLMLSGISDYLDGKLARRWNQISKLGRLLDPAADRLYILSTLVGLTWREILPLWLTGLLLARELMLLVMVGILRRHGYPPPQVNFLGKAATFNLMYAFPLLLLSGSSGWLGSLAAIFGWAFAGWGTTLYWWAGILYVVQVRRLVRADSQAD
ncbi:putative CDP-diacylglycerol--glycerol-3-phosphate 3-phosphatidyl-transferase 2 [Streptomyces sp. YIM 130001]|nr:putative CDP-diacylglycerol--glycerol-3-phosphate 3-phosphatidyl-transferase 2 [Streptomyces sp. YIM 130001]